MTTTNTIETATTLTVEEATKNLAAADSAMTAAIAKGKTEDDGLGYGAMKAGQDYEAARVALQNAEYNASPVGKMLAEINAIAAERGLTVSRWQANKGNHACVVSYAAHTGDRNAQYRHQSDVVAGCQFDGMEGKTTRCEAYRQLSPMLAKLKAA